MRTFGIIGYPLKQTFSPTYFGEKFSKEGIDARYLTYPLSSITEFKGLLEQHPYIAGLNVTIPYKEQVIPYLDELDSEAAKIGAVNVIKFTREGDKLHLKGYNSDVKGFLDSLKPMMKSWHTKALILGTGGASKAVAHALAREGILYRFVSRNPKSSAEVSYADLNPEIISEYKLIINTTPLGMYPNSDSAPDIPYEGIGEKHLAYDVVYNPDTTLFLKKAQENGAQIKNGLDMLYLQAEEAWRIWNL
ncbi:MAG TPA: shikimate dehydrogenase [Bacteroidales bacterium]|jgi:shikimate dehydrogenase|nr:shikimate dehydrogenase [Bacteroidales bacterium]